MMCYNCYYLTSHWRKCLRWILVELIRVPIDQYQIEVLQITIGYSRAVKPLRQVAERNSEKVKIIIIILI